MASLAIRRHNNELRPTLFCPGAWMTVRMQNDKRTCSARQRKALIMGVAMLIHSRSTYSVVSAKEVKQIRSAFRHR